MDFSPKKCLERANAQLALDTEETDRYACLELRQCIEALAYKKLKAYRKRIPMDLLSKWQPAQVISVLTRLEPDSEFDSKISIYQENSAGEPEKHILTFEQKEITTKFISKRYHKLGYYLHTPTVADQSRQTNPQRFHNYLKKLACELSEYAKATTYSTIASTMSFNCSECNQEVIRNTKSLHEGCIIKCFNPQCQAQYIIEEIDNNCFKYILNQAKLTCECGNAIFIPVHRIKENSHVICDSCGGKHLFQKRWQVAKIA